MHPTRVLTCLAATAVAATTVFTAVPGSASAATPAYTLTPITVQVKVGPNNDQPCSVDADLYLPDRRERRKPVPAILTTNGFGGSKDDSNQAAIGKGFATAGYAVLSYSGLGFGKTTCKIELDDPAWDGKAGKQMDDVLAGIRPYVDQTTGKSQYLRSIAMESKGDPRVGMIGGSYGGQIQYAVASQDPRIDTIVPIITWNDLTYSLAPGDVAKKDWVALFFGDGIVSGAENATADPDTMVGGCPNFTDQACTGAAELQTQGYPGAATTALAKHASVATYMSKIKVPTLLVQGEQDTLFNLNEASATYAALKKQGTPVKMVWQSWGHSHSDPAPGELDFGASSLRGSYLGARFLDWMNHYVRGTSSASTGPEFAYFRDWVPYDTDPTKAAAGSRQGLRHEQHGLGRHRPHALLHGQRRTHPDRVEGDGRLGLLRQRRTRADVVLRDLGRRGRRGEQPAHGRAGHVRGLHLAGPDVPGRGRRLTEGHAAPDRAGGRPEPGPGTVGPAGAVRQGLRRGARRDQDAEQPADRTAAGRRRDQAGHRHAARDRAPLRHRPPGAGRRRGQRRGLRRQRPAAARHHHHQPGRPEHPHPADDQRAHLLSGGFPSELGKLPPTTRSFSS